MNQCNLSNFLSENLELDFGLDINLLSLPFKKHLYLS
jgi:hypothetical protein